VECFGDFVTAGLDFVKCGVTLEREAECHSAAGSLPAPQSSGAAREEADENMCFYFNMPIV